MIITKVFSFITQVEKSYQEKIIEQVKVMNPPVGCCGRKIRYYIESYKDTPQLKAIKELKQEALQNIESNLNIVNLVREVNNIKVLSQFLMKTRHMHLVNYLELGLFRRKLAQKRSTAVSPKVLNSRSLSRLEEAASPTTLYPRKPRKKTLLKSKKFQTSFATPVDPFESPNIHSLAALDPNSGSPPSNLPASTTPDGAAMRKKVRTVSQNNRKLTITSLALDDQNPKMDIQFAFDEIADKVRETNDQAIKEQHIPTKVSEEIESMLDKFFLTEI